MEHFAVRLSTLAAIALAGLATLSPISANAEEFTRTATIAPDTPWSDSVRFESKFIRGVIVTIGELDRKSGKRAITFENCGVGSKRLQSTTLKAPGRLLLIYERGDHSQTQANCSMDLAIFFASQPYPAHSFKAGSVDVLMRRGELIVGGYSFESFP